MIIEYYRRFSSRVKINEETCGGYAKLWKKLHSDWGIDAGDRARKLWHTQSSSISIALVAYVSIKTWLGERKLATPSVPFYVAYLLFGESRDALLDHDFFSNIFYIF